MTSRSDRRRAACRCGKLQVTCLGAPERVSVCHCLACQRRTGSAFSAQARYRAAQVSIEGPTREYVRTANSGRRAVYQFCPECGSTVAYVNENAAGEIAIPLGAFIDPTPEVPKRSFFERRRRPWTAILGTDVEHIAGNDAPGD